MVCTWTPHAGSGPQREATTPDHCAPARSQDFRFEQYRKACTEREFTDYKTSMATY